MSRVVVIGATGHIGSYLVPRLVAGGHEVIAMSRGVRGPYLPSPRWDSVTMITVDRDEADADGSFGAQVAALHPGHISGRGWPVITPAGNLDPAVWTRLATGEPLPWPDHGLGVLNHVHADDVAQAFERALARPAAAGASFQSRNPAGGQSAMGSQISSATSMTRSGPAWPGSLAARTSPTQTQTASLSRR